MDDRFIRVKALCGESLFEALTRAHICIIGYGAVGSFAAEALARSGIGHIRIIDADIYIISDINRQLGANTETIGQSKAEIGSRQLKLLNPNLDLECREMLINQQNLCEISKPFEDGIRPEWVIDAIDMLDSKVEILAYCVQNGIRVLSSMGAARKSDPSKITYNDISRTEICPLAREVRKRLRALGIVTGIGCVYSQEPPIQQSHQPGNHSSGNRICRPCLGSIITTTGTFGLRLASECIKEITEKADHNDID